jgi:hypothetical protein
VSLADENAADLRRFGPGAVTEVVLAARADIARTDFVAFNEFVIRDDRTGDYITMSWVHYDWFRLRTLYRKLVVMSTPGLGKTIQNIAYILFTLGHEPMRLVAVMHKVLQKAADIVYLVGRYIEESERLALVFPTRVGPGGQEIIGLQRSTVRNDPWSKTKLTVERAAGPKDPSVSAFSRKGMPLSARVDTVIIDDLVDRSNAYSAAERAAVIGVFWQQVMTRLSGKTNVDVSLWGNPYHSRALYSHLARDMGWPLFKYSPWVTAEQVVRGACRVVEGKKVEQRVGDLLCPDIWDDLRIQGVRERPAAEQRRILDLVEDDGKDRFDEAWLDRAASMGLERGLYRTHNAEIGDDGQLPEGFELPEGLTAVIHAFDPVGGREGPAQEGAEETGDDWGLVTTAASPDGRSPILRMRKGQTDVIAQLTAIAHAYLLFGGHVAVETNGVQRWLVQLFNGGAVVDGEGVPIKPPIVSYYTGKQKWDPVDGVRELNAGFAVGRYEVPTDERGVPVPEAYKLVAQVAALKPRKHSGDLAMALWIADQVRRRRRKKAGPAKVRVTVISGAAAR